MGCFICDKHNGSHGEPPGGYIYQDEHWMVCHFPAEMSVLGRLVIESKRHFLDFADMTDDETKSYGVILKRMYHAVRTVIQAERIYTAVLLEGVPHFHAHLVPRARDSELKGIHLLDARVSCSAHEAAMLADELRQYLVNQYG